MWVVGEVSECLLSSSLLLCRYDSKLKDARAVGAKKGAVVGLNVGFVFFLFFSIDGVAFWQVLVPLLFKLKFLMTVRVLPLLSDLLTAVIFPSSLLPSLPPSLLPSPSSLSLTHPW